MKEAIKTLKENLLRECAGKCRSQEVRNIKKQIANIENPQKDTSDENTKSKSK